MGGLNLPPAVNYPSPLVAIPTKWMKAPPEGPHIIPCEIDWGTMGGPQDVVNFNLQNNAALNFSQVVAISVDNSACGADITFIFPDTTEQYDVPAYAPAAVFPVFTNQTQFFVTANGAIATDVTRFSLHNAMPPPSDLTPSAAQTTASNSSIPFIGTGNTQIIPTTVSGTLEHIYIAAGINAPSAAYNTTIQLRDGSTPTPKTLAVTRLVGPTATYFQGILLMLTQVSVRFQNGVVLNQSGGDSPGGALVCNLYYRSP